MRRITDREVIAAALLHDVGKSVVRVALIHRIAWVLISPCPNSIRDAIVRAVPTFRVIRDHPRIGAALTRRAGGSVRLQRLIAGDATDDPGAIDLRRADESV